MTKTVLSISVLYLSPIILIEIVFNVQYIGLRNMDLVQKKLVHFLITSNKHFVSHYLDSQPPNSERLGGGRASLLTKNVSGPFIPFPPLSGKYVQLQDSGLDIRHSCLGSDLEESSQT